MSYAVLSLHVLGKLEETLNPSRIDFAEYLQRSQDPVSGYFIDLGSDSPGPDDRKTDDQYLKRRTTFLALLALRALKAKAPHPLRFMESWCDEGVISWLDDLWPTKLAQKGERISHVLLCLIYRMETDGDGDAAVLFHKILDWLGGSQTAKNGLWEFPDHSDSDESIRTAGCVLPFFEYVRRPVLRRSRMLAAMIQFFDSGRILPNAWSELALVSAFAAIKCQLNCRQDEIEAIFMQIHDSICQTQRQNGSFGDSEPRANSDEEGIRTAGIETTFLRLSTLAIIEQTLPAQFARDQWRAPDWPGPGYHHPLSALTEHEQEVLPLWLRPTGYEVPASEDEIRSDGPTISVVIPCYNLGRYLHEAVESVLMQTYQDVELIIIDDGSTDDFTAWLLKRFDRPKTMILRHANAGLATTRNRGIARASGRYICCLDPDDRLRPEFFAEAVGVLDREAEVGFVSGFFQMFDERDDTFRYGSCGFPDLLAYNQAIEPAVFRREVWEKVGGYCETFSTSGIEDWDLWISFLELGHRAHVIPDIVWEYRIRSDQMSTEMYDPERWGRGFYELVQRHPQAYAKYAPAILAKQASRWAELRAWANECQRASAWWEAKSEVWQFRAEKQDRLGHDRERWIDTLKQDKKWLEEQRATWQRLAEDREKLLHEHRVWISELESAKTWLEAERAKWQALAEQRNPAPEIDKDKRR